MQFKPQITQIIADHAGANGARRSQPCGHPLGRRCGLAACTASAHIARVGRVGLLSGAARGGRYCARRQTSVAARRVRPTDRHLRHHHQTRPHHLAPRRDEHGRRGIDFTALRASPLSQCEGILQSVREAKDHFGKEPANSFTSDQHPDLRADYVMATPH